MPLTQTEIRRAARIKKRQRAAKRRNRIRLILSAAFIAGVILCVFYFAASAFFKIESVKIEGESIYTAEEIAAAADVKTGVNLLSADMESIEKRVEAAFPYIADAEVKRRLPSTVVIKVTGAKISACMEYNGKYVYVSDSEKILEISDILKEGVIVFKGLKLPVQAVGEQIAFENEMTGTAYKGIVSVLAEKENNKISYVDLSDIYSISMRYDDRVTMLLGSAGDLNFKLKFGFDILECTDGSGIADTERGSLDLSYAHENNHAYFTPE